MLRAVEIYNDTTKTLIAVESVVLSRGTFANGSHLHGQIELVAVVVSDHAGAHALDSEGKPADLDALMRDVPGLASLMA